jgi:hypothetical protein
MKPARLSPSVVGPQRPLVTVSFPNPFALSLSKGRAELAEAVVPHAGFDRLSPNGSLRTLNFAFGPQAETRFTRRSGREAH